MSKRAKLITVLSVLAVLVIAALLYFVPRSTPVELSFHVVKLDKNGKDLGTAEVAIRGKKLDYLFQDSRLDVEIAAFDGVIENVDYGADVVLSALLPEEKAADFAAHVLDATAGTVEVLEAGEQFKDVPWKEAVQV